MSKRRKNYPISLERAKELSHIALSMDEKLGRRVYKSEVLEALVSLCRSDKNVYKKLLVEIQK